MKHHPRLTDDKNDDIYAPIDELSIDGSHSEGEQAIPSLKSGRAHLDDAKLLSSQTWHSRFDYHKTRDDSDSELESDEEDLAEEKEAQRLQKEQSSQYDQDDYFDTFISPTAISTTTDGDVEKKLTPTKMTPISELDANEKKKILARDTPELLLLIDNLNQHLTQIRQQFGPLLTRCHDKQLPTEGGISYLETKYQLLLNYCTNIGFYLLLKAEGKSIKNHPVVEQLAKTRITMEKLKPLDKQLQYQIDKLVQTASNSKVSYMTDPNREKLSHRANIKGFLPLDHQSQFEDGKEEGGLERMERGSESWDDEDQSVETLKTNDTGPSDLEESRYVVPKIASHLSKFERMARRREARRLMDRDGTMEDDEHGDRPMMRITDSSKKNQSQIDNMLDEEMTKFEEDHFVRLAKPKKKGKDRSSNYMKDDFDHLEDFGDSVLNKIQRQSSQVQALEQTLIDSGSSHTQGNRPLQHILAKLDAKMDHQLKSESAQKTRRTTRADEDLDYAGIASEKKEKRKREETLVEIELERKRQKHEEKMIQMEARRKKESVKVENDKSEKEIIKKEKSDKGSSERDGKSKITRRIELNKGLHIHHGSKNVIPRVRNKAKYQKALRKRKGSVTPMRDTSKPYSGEKSGVNRRVIKSVSLT